MIKKKNIYIVFLVIFTIIITGCDPGWDPPYEKELNNSYIQSFRRVDTVFIWEMMGVKIDYQKKTINRTSFSIYTQWKPDTTFSVFEGITLSIHQGNRYISYGDNDEVEAKYYEYISLLGDSTFTLNNVSSGMAPPAAIIDTLSSISIFCNEDFSEDFPAGSDISSLFYVFFENPYWVVTNGYKSYSGDHSYTSSSIKEGFPYAIEGWELNSIDFTTKPFIGATWDCQLTQAPDVTGIYSFDVEVTKTDGKKIRVTSRPFGIKGSE
ncbi:MAG: DUF5034 domain-containing protein [Prevotella sp.]|jgi:hypothetical protein|nr:DUF5034 domain-containing protein [Prevotella sp.]